VCVALLLCWQIIEAAVALFEVHEIENSNVASLFSKKAMLRAFNSAVVSYALVAYDATLSPKVIQQIVSILVSDLVLVPLLSYLEVGFTAKTLVMGKLASTQHELNTLYSGNDVTMNELYSSVFKTLFITLFYLPVAPGGTAIAAATFSLIFFTHKMCCLHHWRLIEIRKVDGAVAEMFLAQAWVAFLVYIVMSVRFYYGWPFDNACLAAASNATAGAATALNSSRSFLLATTSSSSSSNSNTSSASVLLTAVETWEHCTKASPLNLFPSVPHWMPATQALIFETYKWTLFVLVLLGIAFLLFSYREGLSAMFYGSFT
jgi:hypothetical protein